MTKKNWNTVYIITSAVMLVILIGLFMTIPRTGEGAIDWTGQLVKGGWMAWSFPVALFFWVIASLLIIMGLLAARYPEIPRRGILGIETTRGDRLFISLLGSAYINLAWLAISGLPQWYALVICAVYAVIIFRWA